MWKSFVKLEENHQMLFALVIATAVISFWRGLWGLFDYIHFSFFPEQEILGYVVSIAIGVIILLASGYLMKELV